MWGLGQGRFGWCRVCGSRRSAGFSEVLVVGVGVGGQQRSGVAWIVVRPWAIADAQGQEAVGVDVLSAAVDETSRDGEDLSLPQNRGHMRYEE